jgi:hypothetical protein
MPDTHSWEEIAKQFEELDPDGSLMLIWNYDRATKRYVFGYAWAGIASFPAPIIPRRKSETQEQLLTAKFTAYGTRAGGKMGVPGDSLYWWLVEIKLRSQNDMPGEEISFDHSTGEETRVIRGRVREACKMAAALCYALEANPHPRVAILWEQSFKNQPTTESPVKTTEMGRPSGDCVPRRMTLLSEYRSATGNPSNRKIYTARNSGINKPEFYAWLRGDLPDTSKTTINFDKFLHSKKRPIPKNPK